MSSSNAKVLAAIAIVATFVVGIVLGVVGDRMFLLHRGGQPRVSPDMIVHHLTNRLNLSDQQRAQVTEIVERHQQRIAAVTSATRPAVQRELEEANREIEQVLTPEQRETFSKMHIRLTPMHRRMLMRGERRPGTAAAPR